MTDSYIFNRTLILIAVTASLAGVHISSALEVKQAREHPTMYFPSWMNDETIHEEIDYWFQFHPEAKDVHWTKFQQEKPKEDCYWRCKG